MHNILPRWFLILFVAVMLLCGVMVAGSLVYQTSLTQQIADLQDDLKNTQGRLRKQQMEFDQVKADLPAVQTQLAEIQPQADAAYAREQELRQLRKELRAENADLAQQVETLTAQAANNPDMTATREAVIYLHQALTDLQKILPGAK
ncbi:MAG: hypothetical protein IKL25_09555 [Clostridia bacterium]|nr:hypothetical protein [Clostridia bacterium]